VPSNDSPAHEAVALPESPLFSPEADFVSLIQDSNCSQSTCDILRDMRDLTNDFIGHNTNKESAHDIKEKSVGRLSPCSSGYDTQASEIYDRLVTRPSAYTPNLATYHDWVYEACRIAALIYTSAIIRRVPFSVAAQIDLPPAEDQDGHLGRSRLVEALYKALQRTDLSNVWQNMAGVLYWVCSIGAAAARPSAASNAPGQSGSGTEVNEMWIRRCLAMHATRTMVILIFRHPVPVIMAQKRLLDVQELISSHDTGRATC